MATSPSEASGAAKLTGASPVRRVTIDQIDGAKWVPRAAAESASQAHNAAHRVWQRSIHCLHC